MGRKRIAIYAKSHKISSFSTADAAGRPIYGRLLASAGISLNSGMSLRVFLLFCLFWEDKS